VANLFLEGQEADGLLEAAEGDVEGVEVFGLTEEAVEAGLQEVELVQEGGLMGLMLVVVAGGQGLAEMLEVAGEGRGGQTVPGAKGAQGEAVHQGLVDVRQGGVVADGTTLVHGFSVSGFQLEVKASGKGYQGRGQRASEGGMVGRERFEVPEQSWVGKWRSQVQLGNEGEKNRERN
jgi:hypothetical protein